MPTLILSPRFTDDANAMRKAAEVSGWNVERLSSWRAPEWLRTAEPVVYGEPLFAAVVADSLGLVLLEPPFPWLTTLPREFLRREVRFMTIAGARHIPARSFIKPADDKCFPARVYDSGAELLSMDWLADSTPVLASEPVQWSIEFRCFVLERRILSFSPYSRNGELCQDADGCWPCSDRERTSAYEFLAGVLDDSRVSLPPAVVVDVGEIKDSGWAVVESNPAWGSGIYGCDPIEVLRVLQRACMSQADVTEADRRWLPKRGT